MRRSISFQTIGVAIAVLVSLSVMTLVAASLIQLNQKSREAGLRVAAQAMDRAVRQCYALEGAYPPDLQYLADNYGLLLHEDRYVYLYEAVGGNIPPIIKVQFPGSADE